MRYLVAAFPLAFLAITLGAASETTQPARRPNVVLILADDLGYADLGCYGQKKIRTPNLDALARQGMRFTHHYSGNAVCAPSRCVLMTGLHPGHAVVRNNRELKPEGQFPLPKGTNTIASLLKRNGYVTGAFGKWGLGGPDSPGAPLKQGFDRFFGYNCQRLAHTYYPQNLWDNDRLTTLSNPPMPLAAKLPANADPETTEPYKAFIGTEYSADLIAHKAREFVRNNKDRPFFLFWPTTVPHLALQVPEDSLKEYRDLWPDPPYPGGKGYTPQFSPRATYAAMITRLDSEVGRLMELLDELKLAGDTIVIFTSDNGPTFGNTGGSDSAFFQSASTLRGLKGDLYEGGVRVPLIVRWKGHVPSGTESPRVSGFEDWLPTLLELAALNRDIPGKIDGISLAPTLLGKGQPPRPFLYREFSGYGGWQSVWQGEWKLLCSGLTSGKGAARTNQPATELFNLRSDPGEQHNVAAEHPEILNRLMQIAQNQHIPSPDFPMAAIDGNTTTSTAGK